MANTEIFLRNIFGTTRPNIRPLVLALNITNDLLFEQHISMSDIKATNHCGQRLDWRWYKHAQIIYPGQKSALNILDKDDVLIST